jgi:cysteine desulfurase / selenocysteine lyase
VRGTTEAINLVAQSYGRSRLQAGDEIILSQMEHHSNIVPWQMLCQQTGAKLRVIPVYDSGELCMDVYEELLNERTRLVAVTHVSNALGTINPVKSIIALAHLRGVPVLLDGAQAIAHLPVDVQALNCDFYAFSAHKLYGPTGIGVLYGKSGLLEAMSAYQGGGDMIRSVSFEETTYNSLPYKFEAGTPNIAGVIGLGVAIDYLTTIGWDELMTHEQALLEYATQMATRIPGLRVIGGAREKTGILSFVLEGVHPHDIGTILDGEGVAIRAGHHCTMPLMERFGVPATARASFALYNTRQEVDVLVEAICKAKEVFMR